MKDDIGRGTRHEADGELTRQLTALRIPLARFFARKVSDPAEVDDLVQDVFMRVVQSGRSADVEYFNRYVFSAADSVLKDRYRSRRVRRSEMHIAFKPETHAEQQAGPEGELIARETLREAGIALMELPERTRTVFVLRRIDKMTFPQIADKLGLSVSAVEKHMLRATRHLVARSGGAR